MHQLAQTPKTCSRVRIGAHYTLTGLGIVLKAPSIGIFFHRKLPYHLPLRLLGNSLNAKQKLSYSPILQTNLFLGMELLISSLLLKYYFTSSSHYTKLLKHDTVFQIVQYLYYTTCTNNECLNIYTYY